MKKILIYLFVILVSVLALSISVSLILLFMFYFINSVIIVFKETTTLIELFSLLGFNSVLLFSANIFLNILDFLAVRLREFINEQK